MNGSYRGPDGSGIQDTNLHHYTTHVSCIMCSASVPVEATVQVDSLDQRTKGLVLLSGIQTEHDPRICQGCLNTVMTQEKDINSYLNSFAHLSSYHQIMQAIARAYIGVLIVCNLFMTTHILPAFVAGVVFAMCPWATLAAFFWKIVYFPPLGLILLFVPWATVVFFGTNPKSFAMLINDPSEMIPWAKVTLFHENYIYGVITAMATVAVLYIFAMFSSEYLEDIDEDSL